VFPAVHAARTRLLPDGATSPSPYRSRRAETADYPVIRDLL
jgi:hypothetical protein